VIAGTPTSWFSLVEYPEIKSDEIANCAAAVGAALVLETFAQSGFTLADLDDEDETKTKAARKALDKAIADTPLPPREGRLLARSYATCGVDASRDPQPGDLIIVPRGVSWQGHIMQIDEVQAVSGRFKCIGANQSDATSVAYVDFDAEIVAIRRPVPATAKALKDAGSAAVARGETMKNVGDALVVGTPVAAGTVKVVEKMTEATEGLNVFNRLVDATAATLAFFATHPWLLAVILAVMTVGVLLRFFGVETIAKRVAAYAAGVPLTTPKPA